MNVSSIELPYPTNRLLTSRDWLRAAGPDVTKFPRSERPEPIEPSPGRPIAAVVESVRAAAALVLVIPDSESGSKQLPFVYVGNRAGPLLWASASHSASKCLGVASVLKLRKIVVDGSAAAVAVAARSDAIHNRKCKPAVRGRGKHC
jgi:hypothetical protein